MMFFVAIDLKEGCCVRLKKGRMEDSTVFSADPVEQSLLFQNAGFSHLHIVDLDAAVGKGNNRKVIKKMMAKVKMSIQLGGGMRRPEIIEEWLDSGVSYVVIGTMALQKPEHIKTLAKAYPKRIVVALDHCDGLVQTHGWLEESKKTDLTVAQDFQETPLAAFLHTDVSRDGMEEGLNIEASYKLAQHSAHPIILSGGVRSPDDVREAIKKHAWGGIVVGRALYGGKFSYQEWIDVAG